MRPLTLNTKILILTLLPLVLVISAITILVIYQTNAFGKSQAQAYQSSVLDLKQQELLSYMELAVSAIETIYNQSDGDDDKAQQQVIELLKGLEFGQDGYFFIYDYQGNNLGHPRKPELENTNLFNLQDSDGNFIIQDLIKQAQNGGGYTRYLWDKPSSGESAEKMGYAIGLERWQWMIGTGLYIDDIDAGVNAIVKKTERAAWGTFVFISLMAIVAVLIMTLLNLFINLSEGRLTNEKLNEITRLSVQFQENERKRLSRELHDGLSQLLVVARYRLDSIDDIVREDKEELEQVINDTNSILVTSIQAVKRISADLRPIALDDFGLLHALAYLCQELSTTMGIEVDFQNNLEAERLHSNIETVLYRVAQEAFTNIRKHARDCKAVIVKISANYYSVTMKIKDDGNGFDIINESLEVTGLGLRNMEDRVELVGGEIFFDTSPGEGTCITVTIPLDKPYASI